MLFNTVLFTGNANQGLAREIASQLGVELGKALVGRFSDGEVRVEVMDPNAVLTLVDRPDVAEMANEVRGLLVQALEKV